MFYGNVNGAIDNIEIDDSIDTTTTTNGTEVSPPPEIPGFPVAEIYLGLLIPISLILVNRRRNAGKPG